MDFVQKKSFRHKETERWGTGSNPSRTKKSIHFVDKIDSPGRLLGGGNRAANATKRCPYPRGLTSQENQKGTQGSSLWNTG